MNCCKAGFLIIALLAILLFGNKAHDFYNQLSTHLHRETIVDMIPGKYGELDLYRYIKFYQDPCLLYHRNKYLYHLALEHNWTASINLAHEIIQANYPEKSNTEADERRYKLCAFLCTPHIYIDCSARSQWDTLTHPGSTFAYSP